MKKMNLWIGRYGFVKCIAILYMTGIIFGILASCFYFGNFQNNLADFYSGIQNNIAENGIVYGEFYRLYSGSK